MKIKSCPFCGNKATIMREFDSGSNVCIVVSCDYCWAQTSLYETKEEAAKAWNKRTPTQSKEEQ